MLYNCASNEAILSSFCTKNLPFKERIKIFCQIFRPVVVQGSQIFQWFWEKATFKGTFSKNIFLKFQHKFPCKMFYRKNGVSKILHENLCWSLWNQPQKSLNYLKHFLIVLISAIGLISSKAICYSTDLVYSILL